MRRNKVSVRNGCELSVFYFFIELLIKDDEGDTPGKKKQMNELRVRYEMAKKKEHGAVSARQG